MARKNTTIRLATVAHMARARMSLRPRKRAVGLLIDQQQIYATMRFTAFHCLTAFFDERFWVADNVFRGISIWG